MPIYSTITAPPGNSGGGSGVRTVAKFADIAADTSEGVIVVQVDELRSNTRSVYTGTGQTLVYMVTSQDIVAYPTSAPAAPTGGVVDDAADIFSFTPVPGFAVTEHEYSINGAAYVTCTSSSIGVGNQVVRAGQLLVRVKAAAGRSAGPTLANATGFTAIAFRETFANNTGTAQDSTAVYLWNIMFNHPTTGQGQTVTTGNVYVSSAVGVGPTLPVNTTYATDTANGLFTCNVAKDAMFAFRNITIPRNASQELDRLLVYVGNARAEIVDRVAVKIGTTWYVSDATISSPAISSIANFPTQAVLFEVVFNNAAIWRTLPTTGLTPLVPGSSLVSLPAGDITGVGVQTKDTAQGTTSHRFDAFEVRLK